MIRIGLFCAAGMSTSMLVEKMRKVAKEKGVEATINAYPESEMEKRVEEIDVALLGPQVKFMLSKAQGICQPKGVPVQVINTMDYGMMNGEKVLNEAIKMANK
ncbi:PTS sugar transporter subunit IIB [Alkalithermobacter paradoxus]|uniref:Lichenan-specific phosphotransferase enzyme IIB component n=1 Tax=Alkalithermobacter paradoxus TaxID=29349 RepID=A0A1V4I6P0_9FIRM|nr:lichenan-specific phosphotransferase enzyme IIB component [[Clostridium] thermoalcaliphilum]